MLKESQTPFGPNSHIHTTIPSISTTTTTTTRLPPRKASETSSDFGDILSSKAGSARNVLVQNLQSLSRSFRPLILATSSSPPALLLRKAWWIMPMFLAVVPLYCAIVKGTCAAMPTWWPCINFDYIKQSKDAAFVVGCFLSSNIAYFLSGAYLLRRFSPSKEQETNNHDNSNERGGMFRTTTTISRNLTSATTATTRFSMLGIWMLASGLISTIFHSVQALGSHAIAEALCYIDHGIAISAGAYFLETCGKPSKRVLSAGMISLVTLAVTSPGYAWLHSTWHFLSAATATQWAVEGYATRFGAAAGNDKR